MTDRTDGPHEHDLGLAHDLPTLLSRRRALGGVLGVGGLALLTACGSEGTPATTAASSTPATAAATTSPTAVSTTAAVSQIPAETGGPFPADGSRGGVNVLDDSGIVRSDITRSFGSSTTKADGVPLTLALTVLDVQGGAVPLVGAAVYAWHCDRDGRYSLYEEPVIGENYLRGVQVADAAGKVSFRSTYPGCYDGRWPHVHLEVYRTVGDATGGGRPMRTSQLALPADACAAVYATTGYERSAANVQQVSLERDGVFADGYSLQLATVTGAPATGMTAGLVVAV